MFMILIMSAHDHDIHSDNLKAKIKDPIANLHPLDILELRRGQVMQVHSNMMCYGALPSRDTYSVVPPTTELNAGCTFKVKKTLIRHFRNDSQGSKIIFFAEIIIMNDPSHPIVYLYAIDRDPPYHSVSK